MGVIIHYGDLPQDLQLTGDVALDTEAMGLNIKRDRLCLVQLCDEKREYVHLVKFNNDAGYSAPVLTALLTNPNVQKIFHFARFDIAIMKHYLQVSEIPNVFCTRTASLFGRTYTDKHGLKTIAMELLGVDLKKEQQSSNWGADVLSVAQQEYARNDVYYLHQLREKLKDILVASGRLGICMEYCRFLHHVTDADLMGFSGDLFAHSLS